MHIGMCGGVQMIEQPVRIGIREKEVQVFVPDESGVGGLLDLGEERCEEIEDIQESARFGMQVQLGPGEDLAEFVQGAETAGQGHESIGEIRHESFAFVHGVDESEFCDAAVGKFPVFEKAGNDSDDLSATGEDGVRDDAHESDIAPAIDEGELPTGDFEPESPGCLGVVGVGTRA